MRRTGELADITGSERAMIQTPRDLARIGIDDAQLRSPSDGYAILKLRRCVDARQLPSEAVRNEAYLSLKSGDGTLARAGARLMRDVIALCATTRVRVPDDCHWRMAVLLRGRVRCARPLMLRRCSRPAR